MDKKEAKKKAKEIFEDYPNGIGASRLLELVGEQDFNDVLRELVKKLGKRKHRKNILSEDLTNPE